MKGVTFQILNTSIEITFYVTTLHKWVFDWNAGYVQYYLILTKELPSCS